MSNSKLSIAIIRYVHVITFLCIANVISAQFFGDKNAEWVFDLVGLGEFGITKLKVIKDTSVNNQVYQTVYKEAIRNVNGEVSTYKRRPFYIRTDNGVVTYTGNFTFEDTLYNFAATIGDSWTHPKRDRDGDSTGASLIFTVTDTFSIPINEALVFAQEVKIENSNNGFYGKDTLFQGIGSRRSFMLPFDWPPAGIDSGDRGVLRCFIDDDIGVVDFLPFHLQGPYGDQLSGFEYECGKLTNVEPLANEASQISLFPNPANHSISIRGNGIHINEISIYDLSGQFLEYFQVDKSEYQLNISNLPAGAYFLQINEVNFRKVIVVR